jgi:hypothetical protein
MIWRTAILTCLALGATPALAPAQGVLKDVSDAKLEEILNGLEIKFTKPPATKGPTAFDFKTKAKGVPVRLLNDAGKTLMLECVQPQASMDTVNKYNALAKFGRAWVSDDKSVVVSNLDLRGGVTEATIKHFISDFEEELALWAKVAVPVVAEEETFKEVTTAILEKVLNDLKINFNKKAGEKGITAYDFNLGKFPVRLTNFGGKDIMIDGHWDVKVDLERINQWNLKRFFVRAVLYPPMMNKPDVALEANLDCAAGVSESILRSFITSFEEEVRRFDEYLQKK